MLQLILFCLLLFSDRSFVLPSGVLDTSKACKSVGQSVILQVSSYLSTAAAIRMADFASARICMHRIESI